MNKVFIFLLSCLPLLCYAGPHPTESVYTIDSFKTPSYYPLDSGWRFFPGDDSALASSAYDDSKLELVHADLTKIVGDHQFNSIGWLRYHFITDATLNNLQLSLSITQYGASEIFIDGQKINSYGRIDGPANSTYFDPQGTPLILPLLKAGEHVIAVRYANYAGDRNKKFFHYSTRGFRMGLADAGFLIVYNHEQTMLTSTINLLLFGIFIALAMSHLFLYLYYRALRSNLFFSIFCLSFGMLFMAMFLDNICSSPIVELADHYVWVIMTAAVCYSLTGFTYELFGKKIRGFRIITICAIVIPFVWIIHDWTGIVLLLSLLGTVFGRTILLTAKAIYKKVPGARIIGTGLLFFTVFFYILLLKSFTGLHINEHTTSGKFILFTGALAILSVPVSLSLYLAWSFARVNKDLKGQLLQVQHLSEQTLEQEKEKKQILESQKETLEQEVAVRTQQVVAQKQLIELKNKSITDNINYARRIQSAMLPDLGQVMQWLREAFILFLPKDIVSGDFYTFSAKNNRVLIAVGDCTGHGVSGALMSMIGSSLINQIINEKGVSQPALILDQLNVSVIETFRQGQQESSDGMDICVCMLDLNTNELQFAGANRPLWLVRNGAIEVIAPDKLPIGGLQLDHDRAFTNHVMQLQEGDTFYMSTDGYADQFGGEKGKKLMTGRFKELLLSLQDKNMGTQHDFLSGYFEQWKGDHEQVDDVLVVGVRV